MTYAIETKKRKFERILESLTDNSAHVKASLNTRNNSSSTTPNPNSGTDLSKRRRITPVSNLQQLSNASTASLITHYLPSSRLAFLERLESFRQVTRWHISPTSPVNAVEWAKRGWVCEDTDTVSCSQCKERLYVDLGIEAHDENTNIEANDEQHDSESDPLAIANDVLQGLIRRYQDLITTAHTEACPWRRRGCDSSIQRIEGLLNMPTVIAGLEQRYQSIEGNQMDVPEVISLPSSELYQVQNKDLQVFRITNREDVPNINTLKLAICGWQRKESDVIECRHCFRSLGLWLYRGENPTMEHLDPIDSHLEYCPWRSVVAQETEIPSHRDLGEPKTQKLPGWVLVYLAIVKKNNKANGLRKPDATRQTDDTDEQDAQHHFSPEQREKKMKDLMKRIKDLKKPFNVKSLLKRKEKT